MIREATADDIPAIMEMGKRFADDAGVTAQVGWDDESVTATLHHLIDSDDGILLVGDNGMIGGLIYPHPYNRAVRVFQEFFWRSEGREGLRLYKAAINQAKAMGASLGVMIATDEMEPEATGRLYERLGYQPAERHYMRKL